MSKQRKPRSFSVSSSVSSSKAKETSKSNKTNTKASTDANQPKAKAISSSSSSARKPRALVVNTKNAAKITMLPIDAVDQAHAQNEGVQDLNPPLPEPSKKRFGWFKLGFSAFSALFLLGVGLYVDGLINALMQKHEWLGIIALALTAIFVLAIFALILREVLGLLKMRSSAKLRARAKQAHQNNDLKLAKRVGEDVSALFKNNAQSAKARTAIKEHSEHVLDGSDLIALIEREMMAPLDAKAHALVMNSAKRISVVTAVSPRAIVDISYVLYENLRLIRAISELYGGRPTTFGFWSLAKKVITHLAATGAIAVGDGLLQQVIGQGIASKLSSRIGEGVVNGLLCARIGIAAIDVCRPMAFETQKRPGVSDFLSALIKKDTTA